MKASFENSVSVLVRAYMNDTLQHVNCYACAVGNLVVAACGYTYVSREHDDLLVTVESQKLGNEAGANWFPLFSTENEARMKEVRSTGYTVEEISRIEDAFEDKWGSDDDDVFSGLIAVVDVLASIHQIDLSTKEAAIGQFKEVQLSKA